MEISIAHSCRIITPAGVPASHSTEQPAKPTRSNAQISNLNPTLYELATRDIAHVFVRFAQIPFRITPQKCIVDGLTKGIPGGTLSMAQPHQLIRVDSGVSHVRRSELKDGEQISHNSA